MKRLAGILALILLAASCAPPPPIDKHTLGQYDLIKKMRRSQFETAAYLIDLRVDDDGQKYSVVTELYFSADTVGFYGRGYLGKGAFKGNIIDGVATVYFSSSDEYFMGLLESDGNPDECASPGEVLLTVMSLLVGENAVADSAKRIYPSQQVVSFHSDRFIKTVELEGDGYPQSEKMIDAACRDSIVINYYDFDREYPFYKVENLLYYNGDYNFRARGFVREQKYNIDIKPEKFSVRIPVTARRLESL